MKRIFLLITILFTAINFAQIGTLDPAYFANTGTGFPTGGTGGVLDSYLQSDNKLIAVGTFTTFNGTSANRVIRLNEDGTKDLTFATGTGFNNGVDCVERQADGKYLFGGSFSGYQSSVRYGMARLNADGTLDTTFSVVTGPLSFSGVKDIAIQTDGTIIVVGNFYYSTNGGMSFITSGIVKMNANGVIDNSFPTNTTGGSQVSCNVVKISTDGSIFVGGAFTTYGGVSTGKIVKISPSGVLDTTFNTNIGAGANDIVSELQIQADGKILVSGLFTSFNGIPTRIIRLNSDGTTDTTFNATNGPDNTVNTLNLAPNGKIYVGGGFNNFGGNPWYRMARLNSDGSLDTNFAPQGMSGLPYNFHEQTDGKVIMTGLFANFFSNGSYAVNNIVRVGDASLSAPTNTFTSELKVYPNPANDIVTVDISTNGTLEVYDVVGKRVKTKTLTNGQNSINISDFNTGIYLAKITNELNQTKTIKFIKQ